jgi:hypothetical protein
MDPMTAQVLPYLVPLLILVLVLRRNLRSRSLRMERLWVYPAILILAAAGVMRGGPAPGPIALAGFVVALVVGGAIGWYRGRLTQITIDPKTHEFTSRASIAGTILIGVVFAARYGVRMALQSGGQLTWPLGSRLDVVGVTDGLMLFLVGMMTVQRLEMYLRCQKLLNEARANGAAA